MFEIVRSFMQNLQYLLLHWVVSCLHRHPLDLLQQTVQSVTFFDRPPDHVHHPPIQLHLLFQVCL